MGFEDVFVSFSGKHPRREDAEEEKLFQFFGDGKTLILISAAVLAKRSFIHFDELKHDSNGSPYCAKRSQARIVLF